MGRDTFKILFYLRKSKLLKDGKVLILMRITINGKRWDSSLQLGIDVNNWASNKEKAIGNDEGSDTFEGSFAMIEAANEIRKMGKK